MAILAALALVNVALALVHRHWYADGSQFLLQILSTRRFVDFDWTRAFADYTTQLPVVVALRGFGVVDVATLSVLLGLALFLHRVAALALCAVVLGRGSIVAWGLPAFSLLITEPAVSFFIVSEAYFATSAYWVAWSVLMRRAPFRPWHGIVLVVSVGLLVLSYASTVVLAPLLACFIMHRLRTAAGDRRSERTPLTIALVLAVVAFAVGTWAVLVPISPANRDEIPSTIGILGTSLLTWATIATLAAISLQVVVSIPERARMICGVAALVFLCAVGIRPWLVDYPQSYWLHYPSRVLLVVVPAVLSVFGAFASMRPPLGRVRERAFAIQLAVAVVATSAWHIHSMLEWRSYLDRFRFELAARVGVVEFESTSLAQPPFRAYAWEWTQPTVSLLLQAMDHRPIRTVITNPIGSRGQPFDPNDTDQLPDLSMFIADARDETTQ